MKTYLGTMRSFWAWIIAEARFVVLESDSVQHLYLACVGTERPELYDTFTLRLVRKGWKNYVDGNVRMTVKCGGDQQIMLHW